MRPGLSFDHIFPIRDAESAKLARRKADSLRDAGVIDAEDRHRVYARTAAVLDYAAPGARAWRREPAGAAVNAAFR